MSLTVHRYGQARIDERAPMLSPTAYYVWHGDVFCGYFRNEQEARVLATVLESVPTEAFKAARAKLIAKCDRVISSTETSATPADDVIETLTGSEQTNR